MRTTLRCGQARGVSLIETMMFITVVTIALVGTMYSYVRHLSAKTVTEQRRQAVIAAEQKLDEIRGYVRRVPAGNALDTSGNLVSNKANPLDAAFNLYGPIPAATALSRPCCFSIPNFNPINGASVGTVTIITNENPDASQFGMIYDGTSTPNKFGVNIYGDIYQDVQLTGQPARDGTFPSAGVPAQAPFPLDINGNGVTTDTTVTQNFTLLPIVITVRWLDTNGERQRFDLFAILQAESQQ